jgi:hypothetical protein
MRRAIAAQLQRGLEFPIRGHLLFARSADGSIRENADGTAILTDSAGNEVTDGRPAFILSTDRHDVADGMVVRQFWDLSRADPGGVGVPAILNHDPGKLLGQWEDFEVVDHDEGGATRALTARLRWDPSAENTDARLREQQVRHGILRATSVGWMRGSETRLGELDPEDPHYRDPEDGLCGPEEGVAVGSKQVPNRLIEGSLTPIPADAGAAALGRMRGAALRELDALARGELPEPRAVLAWLRTGGADAYVRRLARAVYAEIHGQDPIPTPGPAKNESTAELLGRLYGPYRSP